MIPLIPVALSVVSALAPSLIGMLTKSERAEQLAESVVDAVSTATGQPIRTRDDAASALRALEADPALLAQVQSQMLSIAAAEHEAVMQDRADARERDVTVRGLAPNWRANIMLMLAMVGLVVSVWLAFVYPDASDFALGMVTMVAGALTKMVSDAFAFEFGSSRGSADKQRSIDDMLRRSREPDALAAWRARQ